ncbi:hypothetical protein BST61_g7797 [Cercospora zeina]
MNRLFVRVEVNVNFSVIGPRDKARRIGRALFDEKIDSLSSISTLPGGHDTGLISELSRRSDPIGKVANGLLRCRAASRFCPHRLVQSSWHTFLEKHSKPVHTRFQINEARSYGTHC